MLKNGEGGDGRREVCLPARGCGVEAPHVLRRPGCGHGVTTLGTPTRRDLRQWARHDRRRLATGLTADDTGDLMGTPAGVEHSYDLALEQGAQPARHQIPPALKAQPLRQCVDQRPHCVPSPEPSYSACAAAKISSSTISSARAGARKP